MRHTGISNRKYVSTHSSVNTQTNSEEPPKGEDEELGVSEELFTISERILAKSVDIDLSDSVDSCFKYIKILKTLRDLPPKTTEVNLYLASYGGYVDGGRPLFNALKSCSVPVHVHVIGDCYSMGAILALSGTTLTLAPEATLMYHNYSGGRIGKGKELIDGLVASNDSLWRWFTRVMTPFLTQQEIKALKHDNDVYVHEFDEDINQRIKRHFKKVGNA